MQSFVMLTIAVLSAAPADDIDVGQAASANDVDIDQAAPASEVDVDQTVGPIRETRQLAVLGELGWNGLAGIGVNVSYHIIPYVSLDAGLGLGAAGYKTGLRVRGNLLTGNFTPFLGAGFIYGSGTLGRSVKSTVDDNTVEYEVLGSPYFQGVLGMEYLGDSGFTFLATAGYAKLLKSENLEIISGQFTDAQGDALRWVLGGGIVVSVAFGYTFSL